LVRLGSVCRSSGEEATLAPSMTSTSESAHPRVSVSAISTWKWNLVEDLAFWQDAGIGSVGLALKKLEAAGLSDGAEALARRVTALMRAAGLPTTLTECGVSGDILAVLAEEAAEQWTARFNPKPVTEGELRRLYETAM